MFRRVRSCYAFINVLLRLGLPALDSRRVFTDFAFVNLGINFVNRFINWLPGELPPHDCFVLVDVRVAA